MKKDQIDKNLENVNDDVAPPQPGLPAEFKKRIEELFQGELVGKETLVIETTLSETEVDLHPQNWYLKIRAEDIQNDFFNDDEEVRMREDSMFLDVPIIDHMLQIGSVRLKRWFRYDKPNHRVSYLLGGRGWRSIVEDNKLQEGETMQLWAVQIGGRLCFLLVQITETESSDSKEASDDDQVQRTKETKMMKQNHQNKKKDNKMIDDDSSNPTRPNPNQEPPAEFKKYYQEQSQGKPTGLEALMIENPPSATHVNDCVELHWSYYLEDEMEKLKDLDCGNQPFERTTGKANMRKDWEGEPNNFGLQQIPKILAEAPYEEDDDQLKENDDYAEAKEKLSESEAEEESSDSANYDKNKIDGPYPPPLLPKEFKDKIRGESKGEKVEKEFLVIQKSLTKTDVSRHHCFFSIPKERVLNEYLNDHEKAELRKHKENGQLENISVKFIEPRCEFKEINLKMQNIEKKGLYSLALGWSRVLKDNNLTEGMIVQLWSARVGRKLWLALVNLTGEGGNNTNNAGARNTQAKGSSSSSAPPSDH